MIDALLVFLICTFDNKHYYDEIFNKAIIKMLMCKKKTNKRGMKLVSLSLSWKENMMN